MSITNNRILFSCESISIGPFQTGSGLPVHGVQTASMDTNFNIQQILEIGQLDVYSTIENLPSVSMSIEKCLDGYPLIAELTTRGRTTTDLLARSNQRCDVFFTIFSDSNSSASGVPVNQIYCSGMYLNGLSYRIPLTGPITESATLVGNDKVWINNVTPVWPGGSGFAFNGQFNDQDAPASGIQRRFNVLMGSGFSSFPQNIQGITAVGISGFNIQSNGVFGAHLQDVSINVSLNREDLLELGRYRPYFKYARFPVPVTTSITVTAGGNDVGDNIPVNGDSTTNSTSDQNIVIKLSDGTIFDLGNHNHLTDIRYGGGSVGGEPMSITYDYTNFNNLNITTPGDPG